MTDKEKNDAVERLVGAYETMLERMRETIDVAERRTVPMLREAIIEAREKAVELGELTREEAERVSRYLERDVHDAANFLNETGREFRDWFRFDWQLINQRLLDTFSNVADQTSLAFRDLAERARRASLYHAEEITGPGTLVCTECGTEVHFCHVSRIPPCPNCHAKTFRRLRPFDQAASEGVDHGDVDGD